ncbi:hypothetical protein J1N35_022194 [Gossypium stocksii]|uniref:Aminotransferase-like plant mobile domain-containing protein n=1 Tax=Gossypium stocksii TaxID=47602 RepID=A0A9D4A215_9ROSI|nr:hypothetical protein J1N35_022194 [Gossypium stocksii]
MPNNTFNRVNLKYLPLLENFYAGSYNWRSAVLVVLYYEFCRATKHGVSNMADCLGLLQPWALYRLSFLEAIRHQPYSWPLINSSCECRILHQILQPLFLSRFMSKPICGALTCRCQLLNR